LKVRLLASPLHLEALVPVVAFLAFALAIVFHGFGFDPNPWINWQGLALIGLLCLAWNPAWLSPVWNRRPAA
jgi:hypothetical protein